MTPARGLILKQVGLVIEVLCMLGLFGLARGRVDVWKGFPVDPSRFLMSGLGVGLLLWVTGTVAVVSGRRKSNDS